MPLFTLRNFTEPSGFNQLSEAALTALGIPDPEDREWRIEKDGNGEKTVTVSFTTGPNEYPDFEPASFNPNSEILENAAGQVLKKADELGLKIAGVEMQAWGPGTTTFIFRPFKTEKPKNPLSDETKKQLTGIIDGFEITLVIPQRKLSGEGSSLLKESEGSGEKSFLSFGNEASEQIIEDLGLPENVKGKVKVREVPNSQTDFSLEVNFKVKEPISQETREHLSGNLGALVDEWWPKEKIESATIWIRQGEPRSIFVKSPKLSA